MLKRTKYSQEEKAEFVQAQSKSGLTKRAFCRQEGISYSAFKNGYYRIVTNAPETAFCEVKTSLPMQTHELAIYFYINEQRYFRFPTRLPEKQLHALLKLCMSLR